MEPMATQKRDDRPNMSVKLDQETMAKLEALEEKLRREAAPGVRITRTDAYRAALLTGLEVLLKEKRR